MRGSGSLRDISIKHFSPSTVNFFPWTKIGMMAHAKLQSNAKAKGIPNSGPLFYGFIIGEVQLLHIFSNAWTTVHII